MLGPDDTSGENRDSKLDSKSYQEIDQQRNSDILENCTQGSRSNVGTELNKNEKQLSDDINKVVKSYVIVDSSDSFKDSDYNNMSQDNLETSKGQSAEMVDENEDGPLTSSQHSDVSTPSTITSRRSSIQEKIRSSGKLFSSKIGNNTKTSEQINSTSALPSSLANAISSLSSFTTNFSLGNNSSHNGSNNESNSNISRSSSANLTIETASISTRLSQITETKSDKFNRKASLERKNLINLTKLIVRDLISSSLVNGRTIENETQSAIHLNNYFTLIDRVLKHGLKQNMLTNRSSNLWAALDNLPKYLKEATLMSESIRSLAHTNSADGKIKAWMRLAMMQKKLPEYFNELLAQRDSILKDIYHSFAFMLNDEAQVFAGLIIGVNVIDCNFFVKDDNFDAMDEVIDISPYLRAASSFDEDDCGGISMMGEMGTSTATTLTMDGSSSGVEGMKISMEKILDQKNYLEEWNRHLESTISNLQAKLKQVEEQNSRLEMEAKVSEVRIAKLQEGLDTPATAASSTTHSVNGGGAITDKSIPLISGTSLPLIPDAIKSMINRNRSGTNLSNNTQQATNINNNNISDISTKQPTVDTPTDDSSTIVSATEAMNLEEETKQADSSTAANAQDDTTKAAMTTNIDPNVTQELENYKSANEEQAKELASLRERITILETSYRGALDKIRVLERDLDIQTSINSDKETTIKIYEKDIRDKQQQVEALRTSLADAKKLNSDISAHLSYTSDKLKDRLKSVTQLQTSLDKWKLENKTLASRLQDKHTALEAVTKDLEKALGQIKELKKYNEKINDELRKERECGQSSSVTVEEQNLKIADLTKRLGVFETELETLSPYRDQYEEMKKRCQDYEQSLEEVGAQLRESKLEMENLKENSAVFLDSQWMDSKQVKQCALCQQSFSVTRRKHHCRLCGNVFCQTCSDNKMELASSAKPARVCDTCHSFLLAKFIKQSSSAASAAAAAGGNNSSTTSSLTNST